MSEAGKDCGREHGGATRWHGAIASNTWTSVKSINDFVGRWLLGYPSFVNTDAYRFVHMAHHRQEFGPNEPDIALYANYPITRHSFRRKLMRDAFGITGIPFRSLPTYHEELCQVGYVSAGYEYPSYRALWRALRAG